MKRYGVPVKAVSKLMEMIKTRKASGDDLKKLNAIRDCAKEMGINNTKIDFSIVRGIDYYTGFVFETFVKGYENLGSVASGGRYDSLIGIYSGRDIPATGFGIGIDRLFEIVDVKGKSEASGTKAFVVSVNDYAKKKAVWIAKRLRKSGINAETDLMGRDLRRQLDYANRKKIPYAVIVGPAEIKKRKFTLKDMKTGRESKLGLDGIAKKLRSS
jgi:histidyl-tRNA synthetase